MKPDERAEEALGRIIVRLESRVLLLGELEALTRRRGEAISKDRFESLARIDEARDGVIHRLVATSVDLEQAARDAAGSTSPEVVRLLEEAASIIARIEEADVRDEATLKAAEDRNRNEAERVSVADRASRAYHATGPVSNRGGDRGPASTAGHRTEHTA